MDRETLMNMDPYMALSIVNMKLRDEFSSLDDFLASYNIEKEKLEGKMKEIQYYYNKEINQFTSK